MKDRRLFSVEERFQTHFCSLNPAGSCIKETLCGRWVTSSGQQRLARTPVNSNSCHYRNAPPFFECSCFAFTICRCASSGCSEETATIFFEPEGWTLNTGTIFPLCMASLTTARPETPRLFPGTHASASFSPAGESETQRMTTSSHPISGDRSSSSGRKCTGGHPGKAIRVRGMTATGWKRPQMLRAI